MTELVRQQLFDAAVMFCAGIAFMLLFEAAEFLQRHISWGKAAVELLFWLVAAVITSAFLYYCAYGKISFHAFCSFVLGVLLWKKCFYGILLTGEKHGGKEEETAQKPGI